MRLRLVGAPSHGTQAFRAVQFQEIGETCEHRCEVLSAFFERRTSEDDGSSAKGKYAVYPMEVASLDLKTTAEV